MGSGDLVSLSTRKLVYSGPLVWTGSDQDGTKSVRNDNGTKRVRNDNGTNKVCNVDGTNRVRDNNAILHDLLGCCVVSMGASKVV
jgi:hypothetical protein